MGNAHARCALCGFFVYAYVSAADGRVFWFANSKHAAAHQHVADPITIRNHRAVRGVDYPAG